ncbi:MAG TPA: tetratricopeptide repeat protein [Xanthomarina sp.]|nr:tetratricopeptide repeat protein [Xanthomarina sp.]
MGFFKTVISVILFFNVSQMVQACKLQQVPMDSAHYYYNKVIQPDSKTDLLQAFVYYRNKKEEQLKQWDTLRAIYSLRQLAIIQKKLGILYDSETSAIEALGLLEQLPTSSKRRESKAGIYNHLGRVYSEMQDYANAIAYYKKAFALADNKLQELVLRNNIAYAHLQADSLGLALKEFTALYQESLVYQDSVIIARTLNNLGLVKGKLADSTALQDLQQALRLRLSLKSSTDILGSYLDLSEYYMDQGNKTQALLQAQKAYELARTSNNPSHLMAALGLLVPLKEDPDVQLYKHLMDSVQSAHMLVENKYTSKKYALAAQEALANKRLFQLEQEKSYKYLYGFLALLVLGMGIAVAVYQRLRYKKQKQLEVYHTELRISKKVHDEVANGVYHVMTKIQQSPEVNEGILDDLERVYHKTRDISREHHDIDVHEHFKETLLDLINNYKSDAVNIITKDLSKVDWSLLSSPKKIALYRVLQELLVNMRKHSQASIVVISFAQNQKKITVVYKDNGLGCQLKKQNGLQNTENRIKTLKGSITFSSEINHGFQAKIII